ncbi:MAG: hypothetical protein K5663_02800 [Clostridiales bacterium]|nr:hypothetical protein [Clostridiales bacterium]
MLYPENNRPFDVSLFRDPPMEYRGIPFWAWNCRVTEDRIDRQTEYFRLMGMGGAMLHPRTGMDTEYMSEEYLRLVEHARMRLKEKGMQTWLYDEERFPSGCAGGLVTREMRFRSRVLVVSMTPPGDGICRDFTDFCERIGRGEKPRGYRVCEYAIELDKDGRLKNYARIESGGNWFAWVELMTEDGWYNGQTYVDVLDPEAIRSFLDVTHEKYYKQIGDGFGRDVPAVFTDEPHFKGKHCIPTPYAGRATLCWTEGLDEEFRARWGRAFLDVAPEFIWEKQDGLSQWRYRYHEHVAERFARAYGDQLGSWCEKHGIAYTGHFMSERTLFSQTLALGETMRQYRSQHLPGVDILCSQEEFTTVKQAESVRRQLGREGLVCEMYGVLEWDVSFLDHKLQGDWLAALGVTTRVHHLSFMSMQGEAKRDWPASIFYQSSWWDKYKPLEDYFARINSLLTRGDSMAKVAVVHPIESFWLHFGPNSQTLEKRRQMDEEFRLLAEWLVFGLIDFDYISESMLPALCPEGGCPLKVGRCAYSAIILPELTTVRSTTLERLKAFSDAGGRLIALGDAPGLVDALPSDAALEVWRRAEKVPFKRPSLMEALKAERELELREIQNGMPADELAMCMKQDGEDRNLFICHVRKPRQAVTKTYEVKLKGLWRVNRFDPEIGETSEVRGAQDGKHTRFVWKASAHDSLLLRLSPGQIAPETAAPLQEERTVMKLSRPDAFSLSEPNALLIDRFCYALDGGDWQPCEEVLRLDNILRGRAGLPARNGSQVQPWLMPDEPAVHFARLKAVFTSELVLEGALLAMEQPETACVRLNGQSADMTVRGWYVDEDIKTVALPCIVKGENILEITVPLTHKSVIEPVYLLGCFGTKVAGTRLALTEAPKALELDDICRQGLSFYTGKLDYVFDIRLEQTLEHARLRIKHFAAPVLSVSVDGQDAGLIFTHPYEAKMPRLERGRHVIQVTACLSRFNGFGTLHNADPAYMWYGPDAYRTKGDQWTDSYRLRPAGILSEVELTEITE